MKTFKVTLEISFKGSPDFPLVNAFVYNHCLSSEVQKALQDHDASARVTEVVQVLTGLQP